MIPERLFTDIRGNGPDVLMIHGWAMHSGLMRDFAQALADGGFRVTLVDLPGHGRSGRATDYTLDALCSAVIEIAPPSCHLVGWSLGGSIALSLANQSPKRFKSLSMVAANPKFCSDEFWPGVEPAILEGFAADVLADHCRALSRFFSLQTWGMDGARDCARLLKEKLEECPSPNSEVLMRYLEILRETDLRDELGALSVPTLFLLGARDRLVPAQLGRVIADLAEAAVVHVLPQSAHLPFVSQQADCVRVLMRFWADNALERS